MRFSLLDVFAWTTVTLAVAAAVGLGAAVSNQGPGQTARQTVLASGADGATRLSTARQAAQHRADQAPALSLTAANNPAATTRR